MKDYYRILQITPDASQDEIKRAYRRLAKVHHPDMAGSGGGSVRSREEIFIQDINEAYRTLGNPDKRSHYDWVRTNRSATPAEEIDRNPLHFRFRTPYRREEEEDDLVKPYLPYTRIISRLALAFCLLLALDFFMPLKQRSDKAVYLVKIYSDAAARQASQITEHSKTLIQTWSGRKISVSAETGKYFANNPNLILYSSRLLGEARYLAPAARPQERYLIGSSMYGNFIFLPLLLLLIAMLGCQKRFSPKLNFSFGIVSATLLLICVAVLLI